MAEVVEVPSGKSEAMASRGCRDETVHHGQPVVALFRASLQTGPFVHLRLAERKHAAGKCGEKIGFQPAFQISPLLAFGQQQNAFPDFRYGNDAHEKRQGGPRAQPCCGTRVRVGLRGLAQDVCIEKVIQSAALRGRSLLRAKASSFRSAGQDLKTSQIPFSGSRFLHQSSALTMTTKGRPCFVTS